MSLTAVGKYVVLKPIKKEKQQGSIIIPDTSDKSKTKRARVFSVGDSTNIGVIIGDSILYNSNLARTVEEGDEEFVIVHEDEILAITK